MTCVLKRSWLAAFLSIGKPVNGFLHQRFAGFEQRRWERRLVGRVGMVLGFQAKSVVSTVAARSFVGGQVVAGIKLHRRLRGPNLHHATRCRILGTGRLSQFTCRAADDEAVVKSFRGFVLLDIFSDRRGGAEIEPGAGDVVDFSCRNQVGVDVQHLVGFDRQDRVEHIATARPAQVPVAVVAEVDVGRRVGRGGEDHRQFVRFVEAVLGNGGQRAGVTFHAIGADQRETDAGDVAIVERLGLPKQVVETDIATVKMMATMVFGHLVGFPVDRKLSQRDSIGKPADGRSEMRMAVDVGLQRIE